MADKVTELTAMTSGYDNANDVVAIVDVSDTTQAASGTTKKTTPDNFWAAKMMKWFPVIRMTPTATNGCSVFTTAETTALRPDMNVMDFANGADDHAQWNWTFPNNWNEGTITFRGYWLTSGAVSTGVAIGLMALASGDNESLDTVFGTPIVVTDDAQGAAEEVYITAESGAVTIAGTPAAGDIVHFDVFRDISDGNDDMTQDMRLLGIKIFYTTNAKDGE